MISIKFKDNVVKQYSIDILKEIPFFKSLIESHDKIDNIVPFDNFNYDVIDHLINDYKNIKFHKYDFDELFEAKEYLALYDKPSVQKQFSSWLRYLLSKDINAINFDKLTRYLYDDNNLFSEFINNNPQFIQLYPHITRLTCINKELDLTKFNNLVELTFCSPTISTFKIFNNLRNIKKLFCDGCENLEDGCFDIFENLEELHCYDCTKLRKPFNVNLKSLKILECGGCRKLENGCFHYLINLEKLICRSGNWDNSGYPYGDDIVFNNLKNLKILDCGNCTRLRDGCFDRLTNLEDLNCNNCKNLSDPFRNLKSLKILYCYDCTFLNHNCFNALTNLQELVCFNCSNLGSFDNLINLKILRCSYCYNINVDSFATLTMLKELDCSHCFSLTDECFDTLINLEYLTCSCCSDLIIPFNNLKNLKVLTCYNCYHLRTDCFDTLTNLVELNCVCCDKLTSASFNNLKSLKYLYFK